MTNVVSKYFLTEAGMDDSLSDFQEKKKYNTGPKNVKKPRNNKKPKRTRGQKDIRALIKKQESDVLSYSKDFEKVCKEAGVDVDSEELQLAIALSKSLNEVKKEDSLDTDTKSTEHLTSQQRTIKIKTTLQEYGFKVPKTKITETNRRKKIRKQYKLLLASEEERRQIISDKYSEVLAGNISKSPAKVLECNYSDKELYYKTSNIPYEYIKNDDVYYVKGLFDKTDHKSCLLRNWSEIPGRPISPTIEGNNNINFDNIICNQYELDCILSGTVFAAQQIVTNKNNNARHDNITAKDEATQFKLAEPEPLENEVGCIDHNVIEFIKENNTLKETDCYPSLNTMSLSQVRCNSPDLFDDEVSAVMECTDNDVPGQTLTKSDNNNTYCMDLTECVNIESNNSDLHAKTNLQTNDINITKRKLNDLMEITECILNGSKQINFENIDLTQSSNDSNKQSPYENIEVMDLTQNPDYDHLALEKSLIKEDNSLDDTIIIVDDNLNSKLQPQKLILPLRELPEPICIDDFNNYCENDFISENRNHQSHQSSIHSFEDHPYNKSNENNFERHSINIEEVDGHVNKQLENQPDELDLTQSSNSSQGKTFNDQPISVYSPNLGRRDNISIDYDEINEDIESASVSSLKLYEFQSNSIEKEDNKDIASNHKGLGEFEFSSKASNYSYQSKHDSEFRCITIINDENNAPENEDLNSNNELAASSSKSSEVFEISDKEFNYSLHQSKHENFDFRDVSVMNDFRNYENHSMGEINHSSRKKRSLSESNLSIRNYINPVKEVSQSQKLNFNTEAYNPIQTPNEKVNNVCTPKRGEYVIKTNDITPMLDYASMSSPERHQELEKYGLKPFKRKRAIQLLTYLYNQTHPVIESHEDEHPSPSKRQKKNDIDEQCNSLKTSKSVPLVSVSKTCTATIKPIESTPIESEINKENDLYAVTNEQPDIRNIECDPEDWFFQKREKAKLHSCRVPLHVAFHNYVSCRRRLRKAILCYEPVNIDFIHKDLVATGYRYNPKDLLKFMDRKCITVKTADNNSRNRKS